MYRRPRTRAWMVTPLLLALVGLVMSPAALARSHSPRPGRRIRRPSVPLLHSPRERGLQLGLSGATGQLASGDPASLSFWDLRAHAVQARLIRISTSWAQIAPASPQPGFNPTNPSDPGYDWSGLDQQVRDVANAGFIPLIEVQDAPTWAEGPDQPAGVPQGAWDPNATAFGRFATALATRYDGGTPGVPRVRYWQAWNEPNLNSYLDPQWTASGQPASPGIYRGLENAFYTSVKAVSVDNFVVAAGTAPYGDPDPGGPRMQPVTFDRSLLCLNAQDQPLTSCPAPTYMNAIDDHPYVSGLCCLGPTWHAGYADDTSVPDMYKIVDLLHAAQRAGDVRPAGATAVWATELGWNTNPPNPDPGAASPPAQVAQWAAQALYILWSQGVNTVFWYSLADPATEPPGGWDSTYEEGLYFGDGHAKATAQAVAFPFITVRRSSHLLTAWGRAPRGGMLYVQRLSGRRWDSIGRVRVRAGEVFEVPLHVTGAASFRASVAGIRARAWYQSQ